MSACEKVALAWGFPRPDWVDAMAAACDATSGRAVAARLGVSPAAVSRVLGGTYGDTAAMACRVREIIMVRHVACPVVGEISVETCREHQARPFTAVNPTFVRLYRECRVCPHREADHESLAGTGQGHPASDRSGQDQGGRKAAAGKTQMPRRAARNAGR